MKNKILFLAIIPWLVLGACTSKRTGKKSDNSSMSSESEIFSPVITEEGYSNPEEPTFNVYWTDKDHEVFDTSSGIYAGLTYRLHIRITNYNSPKGYVGAYLSDFSFAHDDKFDVQIVSMGPSYSYMYHIFTYVVNVAKDFTGGDFLVKYQNRTIYNNRLTAKEKQSNYCRREGYRDQMVFEDLWNEEIIVVDSKEKFNQYTWSTLTNSVNNFPDYFDDMLIIYVGLPYRNTSIKYIENIQYNDTQYFVFEHEYNPYVDATFQYHEVATTYCFVMRKVEGLSRFQVWENELILQNS